VANRRNGTICQLQAVVAISGLQLVGEPRPVEGAVQPVTAPIAGEHPTRAIGAMSRGCQTDDQQQRLRVAKIGDGLPPIRRIPECGAFLPGHQRAIFAQAGTRLAPANLTVE
jgi:hypothetical protein